MWKVAGAGLRSSPLLSATFNTKKHSDVIQKSASLELRDVHILGFNGQSTVPLNGTALMYRSIVKFKSAPKLEGSVLLVHWCVQTSTYYLNIYILYIYIYIYASLHFYMCLQNMTPPKLHWVSCCVRYDKIVLLFFFFCIFLCNIFVCVFLFSLKLYFIKKKERKYKKEKKKTNPVSLVENSSW